MESEKEEYLTIDLGFWDINGIYVEDIQAVERSELNEKEEN